MDTKSSKHKCAVALPITPTAFALLLVLVTQLAIMAPAAYADAQVSVTSGQLMSSDGDIDPPPPGSVHDGCLDNDLITVPEVSHIVYTRNGEEVSGTVPFRADDVIEAWYIKDDERSERSVTITREAVGLTSTPCDADGKPLTVTESEKQQTAQHSKSMMIGISIAIALLIAVVAYFVTKLFSHENRSRFAHELRQ